MIMKKILRKYPETLLGILAIIFLAIIIACFSWGIGDVVKEVNRAMNPNVGATENAGFDLKGAKALDLRGLVRPQP